MFASCFEDGIPTTGVTVLNTWIPFGWLLRGFWARKYCYCLRKGFFYLHGPLLEVVSICKDLGMCMWMCRVHCVLTTLADYVKLEREGGGCSVSASWWINGDWVLHNRHTPRINALNYVQNTWNYPFYRKSYENNFFFNMLCSLRTRQLIGKQTLFQ